MRRLILVAVLAALVGGCGGEETVSPRPETVEGQQPQAQPEPQPQAAGDAAAGEEIYNQNGCGNCHTFRPAGSNATTGPNLDELPQLAQKADRGTLQEFTRESIEDPNAYVEQGFPAIMPEYDQLDDRQLADLVAFLTQS